MQFPQVPSILLGVAYTVGESRSMCMTENSLTVDPIWIEKIMRWDPSQEIPDLTDIGSKKSTIVGIGTGGLVSTIVFSGLTELF